MHKTVTIVTDQAKLGNNVTEQSCRTQNWFWLGLDKSNAP